LKQEPLKHWKIEFLATATRQLRKIDKHWQSSILDYLEDEIAILEDPRTRGKALQGEKRGLWRYRVGDYRIICEILDDQLVIAAIMIGHRKDIYK
jgi:mRNA interferase RelE/StbE